MTNPLYKLATTAGVLSRDIYSVGPATRPRPRSRRPRDVTGRVAVKHRDRADLHLGELEIAAPARRDLLRNWSSAGCPTRPRPTGPTSPTPRSSRRRYALVTAKHRMVIGLANDEIGYILPKRLWDEQPPFAYGLTKPPYGEVNSVGPDTAPTLLAAFKRLATR